MQRDVMRAALARLRDAEAPGEIVELPYRWTETEDWKDRAMRPETDGDSSAHQDDRSARLGTPQYQSEEDAALADPDCPSCIFPDAAISALQA